jgi:hypothetical protein
MITFDHFVTICFGGGFVIYLKEFEASFLLFFSSTILNLKAEVFYYTSYFEYDLQNGLASVKTKNSLVLLFCSHPEKHYKKSYVSHF